MSELNEVNVVRDQYLELLEKARKQFPAITSRLSNTITKEDKARLISGDEFNPQFSYPKLFEIDTTEIQKRKDEIASNMSAIDDLEKSGYTPSVTDELDKQKIVSGAQNLMFLELAQILHSPECTDQEAANRYMQLNTEVYGPMNEDLYQGLINYIRTEITKLPTNNPNARQITDELIEMLPGANGDGGIVALPSDVFEKYQAAYTVIFRPWLEKIIPKKEGMYDATEIAEVFRNALESMGFDSLGWKVVVSEDATSIKISMEDKEITIPADRQPLEYTELCARVVHEIGHVTRGWNGSFISRSAEHGLPEYLDAEEGLMAYGEQFIEGKQTGNVTYMERYVGAGMMTGTLDGAKKDFKDTYAAMWRTRVILENLDKLQNGEDLTEDLIEEAKETSLMNARRLFRGGNGAMPGIGWIKDKVYYEGMAKLTDYLVTFEEKFGVENMYLLFGAKFDPTNDLHNRYIGMPTLEGSK